MAETQHNPELATQRIAALEDTPSHRPEPASASEDAKKREAYLKEYNCLYFGYASNLSPRTMKQRCPDSLFISLGRLPKWRWMINETGYANIVPGGDDDEVWGSLCFLSRRDEMALDESEGVPWMYEKHTLKVQRVPQDQAGEEWKTGGGDWVEATGYVDVQRLREGKIEKEYVVWINKAIADAKACGMPEAYAEKYLRKYLPVKVEGDLPDQDIMMIRTMQFGERSTGLVPRGFASWDRG